MYGGKKGRPLPRKEPIPPVEGLAGGAKPRNTPRGKTEDSPAKGAAVKGDSPCRRQRTTSQSVKGKKGLH